ncbi:uncharacterized protein LOC135501773 [Lineus longissimus]|uniref:uncharacterized protein LOC135501773 n=1 Tax=Lineus longissimus TaxID=88925 RepID=UPI002B4D56AC
MDNIIMTDQYIDTTDYDQDDWNIILEQVHKDNKDICSSDKKIHLSARNVPSAWRYLKVELNTKTVSATGTHDDPATIWKCDKWSDGSLQFITDMTPNFIMYICNWQLMARKRDKKTDDKDDQTKFIPYFLDQNHCTLESKGTRGVYLAFDDTGRFKNQRDGQIDSNDKHLLLQIFKPT